MRGSDPSSGGEDEAMAHSWSLASSMGATGGGVDGAFLTEPGSYEDFEYPSPFDFSGMPSFASSHAGPSSRSYSPIHGDTAFSPLPSFSPFPSYASHSHATPPIHPPPTPPPLFDSTETALFSSFLNTLDVDINFLFNPVLPPGMPSPPSSNLLHGASDWVEEERREREELGKEVGELSLGGAAALTGWPRVITTAQEQPHNAMPSNGDFQLGAEEAEQRYRDGGEDLCDENDFKPPIKAEEDDDPDFEPSPRRNAGAARRKSRSGGTLGSGTGGRGKKPRVGHEKQDEDVDMADDRADDSHDEAEDSVATVTVTSLGRPKRATRAPRRLSSDTGSRPFAPASAASPASPKPSLSKPRPLQRSTSPQGSASLSPAPNDPKSSLSASKAALLTDSQKRSNHILSEQKRRNAIRTGFKDLVDLLVAGEAASGIVLGPGSGVDEGDDGGGAGKKRKGKGTGRGRGRKGEVGANASKSVVLEKAASYILWLERGNLALEREVECVEGLLRGVAMGG
ncbi:hypothetical protein JCM1841_002403 [Sporobolomyces salmonicolor]